MRVPLSLAISISPRSRSSAVKIMGYSQSADTTHHYNIARAHPIHNTPGGIDHFLKIAAVTPSPSYFMFSVTPEVYICASTLRSIPQVCCKHYFSSSPKVVSHHNSLYTCIDTTIPPPPSSIPLHISGIPHTHPPPYTLRCSHIAPALLTSNQSCIVTSNPSCIEPIAPGTSNQSCIVTNIYK